MLHGVDDLMPIGEFSERSGLSPNVCGATQPMGSSSPKLSIRVRGTGTTPRVSCARRN